MIDFERAFEPILARLRLLVGRCVITATKYKSGEMQADVECLAGEKRRGLEFSQQYGFSSRPKGDVSGVVLFVGGSRENGIVVSTHGDESDMAKELSPGEVCVHSPFGSSVLLKEDGSVEISAKKLQKIYLKNDVVVEGNLDADLEVTAGKKTIPVTLTKHVHATAVGPSNAGVG